MSDEYKQKLSESHKGRIHTEEQKEKIKEKLSGEKNPHYGKFGLKSSTGIVVYCITLNRFFGSAADARRILLNEGISNPNPHCILDCCKEKPKRNTAGKLNNGTKLKWRFATPEEVILLKSNDFKQ